MGAKAYGFVPDFDEKAYTDCLRVCTGEGLRIVYGFVPDVGEKVYGLFTGLYRMLVRRLTDGLRICTGFG